jgi:hypothetical protein
MNDKYASIISKVENAINEKNITIHKIDDISIATLSHGNSAGLQAGRYACVSVSLIMPIDSKTVK